MRFCSQYFRLALIALGVLSSGDAFAICNGHYGLKINELVANPDGSDSSALGEWVEVYNAGSSQVNLAGWAIERAKSSSSNWSARASLSGTLSPGEIYTVGELNAPGAIDLRLESGEKLDFGNAGSNADGVRLVCDGSVADTVLYGPANVGYDDWQDDSGLVASDDRLAPKPIEGQSLARIVDGVDSDDSGADFCGSEAPSPGGENACDAGSDTGDTGIGPQAECDGDVVINEIMTDPEGSDGGYEWVEIYNADSIPVPLNGWAIEAAKSGWSEEVELFGILPAGAYLLIGEENVSGGVDIEASLDFGNASTSSDGVRLVCGDGVADTVLYGSPNSDEFRDDGGGVATSLAEVARGGQCLARIQNGYDTDLCGLDLAVVEPSYCSPGGPNPAIEPPVCDTENTSVI
ncbi:MAG: lamin tail domain-containing protein, partial [Myxococcota bacterium]|nr:lamin tail domain-containing protein [Myxococcota bacterium]